jgi:ADP-ribosylglycohydrolase
MGKFKILTAALLFAVSVQAEFTISQNQLVDKARGMWLGQIIANYAGRATEGKYKYAATNPAESVPWILKETWDADDDTDIEYIAMHVLETAGFEPNYADITNQWLEHITFSGIYISNRQALYLLNDGFTAPASGGRNYNMHWYSIDSQITTEVLGAVSPGLAQKAVDMTSTFAHVSNAGFPVHAAQFYAAMVSYAYFDPNVHSLVDKALTVVPSTSRTHDIITDVKNWYQQDIADGNCDWRATRQKLYDHYQGAYDNGRYYNWIESAVNTGATVMALLYGNGDFKETVQIGILAGWDCDCNPATAAAILGTAYGYSSLPGDLTDPNVCGDIYKNVYRPLLPDPNQSLPQYDTITNIAQRIAALAGQNILAHGGYVTQQGGETIYHIPESQELLHGEAPLPDPNGPKGLVQKARSAGVDVTCSASVQNFVPTEDRKNLNAIIDGITDNSHNGHKAYYTYVSDVNARCEKDFYQLTFSSPVRFEQVTFYEGDLVWAGVNTYTKTDDSLGGYFEDITVEVLRGGQFVTAENIRLSEQLERTKMYQTIRFDFEPIWGTAIRIIGTPGGTNSFTTILELECDGSISAEVNDDLIELFDNWLGVPAATVEDFNLDGILNFLEFADLSLI